MFRARITQKRFGKFPCEELRFVSKRSALAFVARRWADAQVWALELLDPSGQLLFFFCREG